MTGRWAKSETLQITNKTNGRINRFSGHLADKLGVPAIAVRLVHRVVKRDPRGIFTTISQNLRKIQQFSLLCRVDTWARAEFQPPVADDTAKQSGLDMLHNITIRLLN